MGNILPFVALNAASSTGPGPVMDLNGTANEFTVFSISTGSPTSLNLHFEGSHDGINWFNMYLGLNAPATGEAISTQYWENGCANTGFTRPKPHARFVRMNLITLTGGTSPTVTATVAVGKVA